MTNGCGPASDYIFPAIVTAIGVDNQCALLGGYVYRGGRFPALVGRYLYADFCAGHFYDALFESGSWQVNRYDQLAPFGIVSLGEDNDGELYSVNYDTGRIHAIIDGTPESFADTLYLTPRKATTVGGVSVTASDIVKYNPTTDDWSLFFDGSDVGLTKSAEQIDAIAIAPNGRLLISTTSAAMVAGQNGTIKAQDEDLLAFNATNLGANSAGTWALYLDGSTIPGLAAEDLTGAWVDPSNNDLYLAVANAFNIDGQQGNGRDIFIARPSGDGTYDILPYWQGTANGFSSPLEDFAIGR